ncbi:Fc.00g105840.m01.CDS01 [Cosmosporella sp. VM-42]
MGLHRDTPAMGLSPFQLEIRRRVWWQICTLDVRIAEDHGNEPSILESTFDTGFPLNINDISLDPNMHELPLSQQGRTEMLFSLVRFHGSHFARRVVFSDNFCRINSYSILTEAQKCQLIDEFGERIEEQFLSHCNTGVPLDFVTATSMRLILVKLKLAVCKPTAVRSQGTPLKANYQKVCYEVLKQAHALRRYEKGIQWLWLFQTYVEWDAMAYLLLDMCIQARGETVGEAWNTVNEIYCYWKDDPDIHHDRRWSLIEQLRRQALGARGEYGARLRTAQVTSIEDQSTTSYSHTTKVNDTSDANSIVSHGQALSPATETQVTGSDHPGDQVPLVEQSTRSAATFPYYHLPDNVLNAEELPGTGTTCEWSASLFEQYWEVAELGEGNSMQWL